MTIVFRQTWGPYSPNDRVDLGPTEEARLIVLGLAADYDQAAVDAAQSPPGELPTLTAGQFAAPASMPAGVLYLSPAGAVVVRKAGESVWSPVSGDGTIGGVTVTGTPTAGQVPTATSGTEATWQTPSGGGGAVSSVAGKTGAVTLVAADLTDSTATGRALVTAATAAAARGTLGAAAGTTGSGTLTEYAAGAGNGTATANYSAGFGPQALAGHTSGANMTAFGYRASWSATTSSNGVSIGYRAQHQNSAQVSNTAVGADALFTNNSSGYHTAVGHQALFATNSAAAVGATAVGSDAGFGTTTAANFTAIGRRAGYNHTTGADSTYIGAYAGYSGLAGNNTGEGLTAVGVYALGHNTNGSFNIAVGRAAMWYNTTGSNRASLGYRAGYGNTTGNDTVEMGFYAGHNSQGSSRTVMIGALADNYIPAKGSFAAAAAAGAGLANSTLTYAYRVAFVLDGVETAFSEPANVTITAASGNYQVALTAIPVYTGPKSCTARRVYRTPGYVVGTAGDHLYGLVTEIGNNTTTTYTDSTPDGSLGAAPAAPSNAVAIGYAARTQKPGQLVIGSNQARITEAYIGGGVEDVAPARLLLSVSDASGSNLASGGITLAGGQSTGTADGGSVRLAVSRGGSSGSVNNALVTALEMFPAGHAFIVNATAAPSGTPTGGGWLYVEAGALKYKGSSGTVTTLAVA